MSDVIKPEYGDTMALPVVLALTLERKRPIKEARLEVGEKKYRHGTISLSLPSFSPFPTLPFISIPCPGSHAADQTREPGEKLENYELPMGTGRNPANKWFPALS